MWMYCGRFNLNPQVSVTYRLPSRSNEDLCADATPIPDRASTTTFCEVALPFLTKRSIRWRGMITTSAVSPSARPSHSIRSPLTQPGDRQMVSLPQPRDDRRWINPVRSLRRSAVTPNKTKLPARRHRLSPSRRSVPAGPVERVVRAR